MAQLPLAQVESKRLTIGPDSGPWGIKMAHVSKFICFVRRSLASRSLACHAVCLIVSTERAVRDNLVHIVYRLSSSSYTMLSQKGFTFYYYLKFIPQIAVNKLETQFFHRRWMEKVIPVLCALDDSGISDCPCAKRDGDQWSYVSASAFRHTYIGRKCVVVCWFN